MQQFCRIILQQRLRVLEHSFKGVSHVIRPLDMSGFLYSLCISHMSTHQALYGHQRVVPYIPILVSHQLHHSCLPPKFRHRPGMIQLRISLQQDNGTHCLALSPPNFMYCPRSCAATARTTDPLAVFNKSTRRLNSISRDALIALCSRT